MNVLRRVWLLSWALACYLPGLTVVAQAGGQSPQPANQGMFDGPAELPRIQMKTALADTPAPGKTMSVKSGGDLQAALDGAACGDTLRLEAGTTFVGRFRFPQKPCDDAHWIIIRTSAPDEALPPEGKRLAPCYAGVASLPGRPDFHCASTKNVMAKLLFTGQVSGPLLFAEGANHYRFIGIEITREVSAAGVVALAGPEGSVGADHFIFDRVWMHGTAQDDTRRGLYLSGTRYMAVVDSFFSDFHCAAKGSCTDSQAISGAAGDLPMGPYKIVNNFLEAAGENLLFGGSAATATPTDIEIRHNHLFKPMLWMSGQPGFVGGSNGKPFIVKNHFELKNAQRVLFEGNVLDNNWGGFSQAGSSVGLTPKNQNNGPGHNNLCPLCRVTDITIRDCVIAHVGGGLVIGNIPAPPPDGPIATAGERYSIHDIIIDDIDGQKYDGFGTFLVMISNRPTLKDVRIDHVTAVSPRVFLNLGVRREHIRNFVFTNNLIGANEKQITSTGGGPDNCAFRPEKQGPAGILKDCFDSITFTNNAIINALGAWPPGNFFPKDAETVGFVKEGNGTETFRLCRAKSTFCKGPSKYIGAGSDHKDVGADIDLVMAATRGVID
jgi:hypothetical protein